MSKQTNCTLLIVFLLNFAVDCEAIAFPSGIQFQLQQELYKVTRKSIVSSKDLESYTTFSITTPPRKEWLTVSAILDFSHRTTQFFRSDYRTNFMQWDIRLEFWTPSNRCPISSGPYFRLAGFKSNHMEAFENMWLSGPGFGIQAYPFSFDIFRAANSTLGKLFGPLRLFIEYNRLDYWHEEDFWRPDEQLRTGFDYYKGINVQKNTKIYWAEIYNEITWKSANEFNEDYSSFIMGNALRVGMRIPNVSPLSMLTPYLIIESTLSQYTDYYWENRLVLGSGFRIAPDLRDWPHELDMVSRSLFYVEWLQVTTYYQDAPSSTTPDFDVRLGISFSIGDYWK